MSLNRDPSPDDLLPFSDDPDDLHDADGDIHPDLDADDEPPASPSSLSPSPPPPSHTHSLHIPHSTTTTTTTTTSDSDSDGILGDEDEEDEGEEHEGEEDEEPDLDEDMDADDEDDDEEEGLGGGTITIPPIPTTIQIPRPVIHHHHQSVRSAGLTLPMLDPAGIGMGMGMGIGAAASSRVPRSPARGAGGLLPEHSAFVQSPIMHHHHGHHGHQRHGSEPQPLSSLASSAVPFAATADVHHHDHQRIHPAHPARAKTLKKVRFKSPIRNLRIPALETSTSQRADRRVHRRKRLKSREGEGQVPSVVIEPSSPADEDIIPAKSTSLPNLPRAVTMPHMKTDIDQQDLPKSLTGTATGHGHGHGHAHKHEHEHEHQHTVPIDPEAETAEIVVGKKQPRDSDVRFRKGQRFPKPFRSIFDVRKKLERYEDGSKRFLLVGLDYECTIYEDVGDLSRRIKSSLDARKEASLRRRSESGSGIVRGGLNRKSFSGSSRRRRHRRTASGNLDFSPPGSGPGSAGPHFPPATPSLTPGGRQRLWVEPFWIDIQSPEASDLEALELFFSLHHLTTEDCLDNDSGEKWEMFPNYLFVCVRTVDKEIENQFEELNVLVFRQFVITIHRGYFEEIENVLKRIEREFETGLSKAERALLGHSRITADWKSKYDIDRLKKKTVPVQKEGYVSSTTSTEAEDDPPSGDTETSTDNYRISQLPTIVEGVSSRRPTAQPSQQAQERLAALRRRTQETVKIPERRSLHVDRPMQRFSQTAGAGGYQMTTEGTFRDVLTRTKRVRRGSISGKRHRRHRHRHEEPKLTTINSPCWILYLFVDVMTDMYLPLTQDLATEIRSLDTRVLKTTEDSRMELLQSLGDAKRKIDRMKMFIVRKVRIVKLLMSSKNRFLTKTTAVYMRDVVDHLQQCQEMLESSAEELVQAHSNFMIQVSIEIAKSSKQTDAVMDRITLFASILAPLALMSGIWGMNVPVPGQYSSDLWWFCGVAVAMLAISIVCLVILSPQLIPEYYRKFKKMIRSPWRREPGPESGFNRPAT